MHRIDGAGHIGGMFVAEDPAINRPPTEITAAWLNAFQEELSTLVEWAGLVLNIGDNTQLRQALLSKFLSAASKGNAKGSKNLGISAVLLADDVGKEITLSGAGGVVATLPLIGDVPDGARLEFVNVGSGISSVSSQGANLIDKGGVTITSVNLGIGDTLVMVSNGAYWNLVGGSAQLPYAAVFSGNLTNYQRLPGGLIFQWGYVDLPINSASVSANTTFPIAFPGGCLSVIGSLGVQATDLDVSSYRTADHIVNIAMPSPTGFEAHVLIFSITGTQRRFSWHAIGY